MVAAGGSGCLGNNSIRYGLALQAVARGDACTGLGEAHFSGVVCVWLSYRPMLLLRFLSGSMGVPY